MTQVWTRYFTDKVQAMAAARNAKEVDKLEVTVVGPVKMIRRPKSGGGLETWPTNNQDHYVVMATGSEMLSL
jgi:hypothetical protein